MEPSITTTVGVIDKTVEILEVLADQPLALNELAAATQLPKSTLHRLCAALEAHGLIDRTSDDRRRLGSRLISWAQASQGNHELELIEIAEPYLRRLRDETEESVQLYVLDGDRRRAIAGLESPHGLRTIVQVGALLPLEKGSAGAILRGDKTALKQGWAQSVEEREKGVTSVSAPVVVDGVVVAAISVSGPIERTGRSPGHQYGKKLQAIAEDLASALTSQR